MTSNNSETSIPSILYTHTSSPLLYISAACWCFKTRIYTIYCFGYEMLWKQVHSDYLAASFFHLILKKKTSLRPSLCVCACVAHTRHKRTRKRKKWNDGRNATSNHMCTTYINRISRNIDTYSHCIWIGNLISIFFFVVVAVAEW